MSDKNEKLKIVWEKFKKNKYIVILLLAGLVLILWPSGKNTEKKVPEEEPKTDEVLFSVKEQEAELTAILCEIKGAGNVKVLLTMKTGTERVIASDSEMSEKSGADEEKDYEKSESAVIISNDSNADEVITLKYIYPEYLGAIVVAEGADNPEVELGITRAVASATGLPSDKITVLKMK